MYWHCADLWFAVTQKMLFSQWTAVFYGRSNLLNSRQFSFINQAETGVKSYKEQTKLTLFRDCKPSWICNKDVACSAGVFFERAICSRKCHVEISQIEEEMGQVKGSREGAVKVATTHELQHITRADFFWERDSLPAICSIFDSFHVGLLIPKITETRGSFHVLAFQTKHHDQM